MAIIMVVVMLIKGSKKCTGTMTFSLVLNGHHGGGGGGSGGSGGGDDGASSTPW